MSRKPFNGHAMARSHTAPYMVWDNQPDRPAVRLAPVDLRGETSEGLDYDEAWLQEFIFKYPDVLPIREIEPIFAPAAPICRELATGAGAIDVLFSSPDGFLTLVETKLWRNPEARRSVVAQLLDYSKELRSWSYEDLDAAVRLSTKKDGESASLFAKMNSFGAEVEEEVFVDTVAKNLARGRFLLIIAGDGIREEIERLTAYLQRDASVSFTLALVELAFFKLPDEDDAARYVVNPRVLARTIEIERAIVRIEDSRIRVESPLDTNGIGNKAKGSTLTRDEIFEKLSVVDPELSDVLRGFLKECEERGLIVSEPGRSLAIQWPNDQIGNVNFGTVFPDGRLNTNYLAERAEKAGDLSIAECYLTGLANLVHGKIVKQGNTWTWRVVTLNGKLPAVASVLSCKDEWLTLIEKTIELFRHQLDKVTVNDA